MPLEGFESTIPVFKRAKTFHALDHSANVTGITHITLQYSIFCMVNLFFTYILDII
jgi:hypothetical protein